MTRKSRGAGFTLILFNSSMAFYILSFAVGIWQVSYLAWPPYRLSWLIVFSVLILIISLSRSWLRTRPWLRTIMISGVCAWLGFGWGSYQAHQWLQQRLPEQWAGKEVLVTGIISRLPQEEHNYTRFGFRAERFNGESSHKKLQLNWQQPHPPLRVGERWQFSVRLKPPHSLVNFNTISHLRNWWAQNIHATGYVVTKRPYRKISPPTWRFLVTDWRQALQHEITQAVTDPTAAATLTALTIGVEEGLSAADWLILQRTGTVHLVVIAGLHIGLMVLVAYFLGNWLWRCLPQRLLLRFPAQRAGAVTALIFALGYGTLAGFNLPTQRAVLMTVVLMSGRIFVLSDSDSWRRLLMAFAVIVALQPGALFSPGFWLSFAAIAWITYSLSDEWRRAAHWRQWLRMQGALFLGLTPLTVYFFQQFSWVSLIANPPAILWIGWLIVPLCLLAALLSVVNLSASQAVFQLAAELLTPLWHFLQWLASWRFAGDYRAFASEWLLLPALGGALWCLAPRFIPLRWMGLLGFLPLWLWPPPKPPPGDYWATLLDVGQGLAVVVQTRHHLLIYDTGPHIFNGYDAGRDVITPYLITLGISKIDLIMVSHGDNDHSGGVESLINRWPVQNILTSIPKMFAKYHPDHCNWGQDWQWDGVPFKVLGPPPGSTYEGNNSSCILQIGTPGRRLLLTGDIESSAEAAYISQYGSNLASEFMTAPHHGSRTSSTQKFLDVVHPQQVWLSLGYYNRFHFPAPGVVERYQALGAKEWITARDGAISLHAPASAAPVFQPANPHKYFWN